jgi:transcriptional regulator with PAS, ATPase and Fis domain
MLDAVLSDENYDIHHANKRTHFLDEIAELPLPLQSKILRVLQEREVETIGSSKTTKVDVRILAATNKNLENEMRKGTFREDLYYGSHVMNIEIPLLRERLEDIHLLANFFLKHYAEKTIG